MVKQPEKVNFIHLPPGIDLSPEYQLFVFIRIYHVVKYLREHHPMRYHRMTEILKTISSVKLSSTFLLKVYDNFAQNCCINCCINCCTLINDNFKSYFLKKPLSMLCAIYIFNVFAVGYIIYAVGK